MFQGQPLKLVTHVQTLTPRHEFLIIFLKQMFGDTRSFENSCGMAHLSIDF